MTRVDLRHKFPAGQVRAFGCAMAVATIFALAGLGLGYARLPSRARIEKAGVAFSIVGPARYESMQPVVVELVVENRSKKTMRLLKPSMGASSVNGTVVTPRRTRQLPDPLGALAREPVPVVEVPAGGRLTKTLDLTYLTRMSGPSDRASRIPGSYTLTLHYSSQKVKYRATPSWFGDIGPVTFTFQVAPGEVAAPG